MISKVARDWYNLAIQLFNESQLPKLDQIRATYSTDLQGGCGEMFKHWLQVTPGATWDDLLHALRTPALQLFSIANDVEKQVTG